MKINTARSKFLQAGEKALLQSALQRCKKVTLIIDATGDATEIVAHKTDVEWTVNKSKGCMPMVGHSAETGMAVASSAPGGALTSTGVSI